MTAVFGMSFGEVLLLGVIALVVVGPRNLPTLLRSLGQFIGRARRMALELRTESGIDEILDAEGIRTEIDNFKRLATGALSPDYSPNVVPDREREYPRIGPDAYGAFSEDLVPYVPAMPPASTEPRAAPDFASAPTVVQSAPVSAAPSSAVPSSAVPSSAVPPSTNPTVASLPGAAPASASPSPHGAGIKN